MQKCVKVGDFDVFVMVMYLQRSFESDSMNHVLQSFKTRF